MEKRLQKANPSYSAGSNADAVEQELQLSTTVAGPLTTRERIGRDRDLYRLNLHAVDGIPKDVLVHTTQVLRKPHHRNVYFSLSEEYPIEKGLKSSKMFTC